MKGYIQYTLFQLESGTDEFIILNFQNRGHYNLINIYTDNNIILSYENNKKEINDDIFKNKNKDQKRFCHFKTNEEKKDISNFVEVGDDKLYYNNLFDYLKSYENAKFKIKMAKT